MQAARDRYKRIDAFHLYAAIPIGLAALTGQLMNTFGPTHIYEHLPTNGIGSYQRQTAISAGT
jgi:hypothetical protein